MNKYLFTKMKNTLTFLLGITLLISSQRISAQTFVHPGLLHTAADFTRMRTKVQANAQPWLAGWNVLINNSHAQSTYTPNPVSVIYRGGNYPQNYSIAMNDAAAAYQCALRWEISQDNTYANKAIQILNAWANVCTGVGGDSNEDLAVGLYGFDFANAAEIMRTYSGWQPADFAKFQTFMRNVFYAPASSFLYGRNGTCSTHYWANWGLCNAGTIIAVGVLCDDITMFNEGMYYIKSGPYNEAIKNVVYHLFSTTLGQWQESNRDQGHTLLGVGLAAQICEVAWNQGENLYTYDTTRLLAGFNWAAEYNLGNSIQDTTYNNCDNVNQTVVGSSGRGEIIPEWECIYNHFTNRMGIKVPYIEQYADLARPEGGGGNYGTTSGGFDLLGFGTLTKTLDTLVTTCPPTSIAPYYQVNGGTQTYGANFQVNSGDNVVFEPATSGTGTWAWSSGATTQNLTLNGLTANGIYRVVYTNSCGTQSSQYFSVAVKGDCNPTPILPYVEVNGTWVTGSNLTVTSGSNVILGPQPSNGGTWLWGNGATTNELTYNNVQSNINITATYTFPCGADTTATYVVTVLTPQQQLDSILNSAIELSDTTQTSTNGTVGTYSVTAKALLNDSITYVQANYNSSTSTTSQINGFISTLTNAINNYQDSIYYSTNTLQDGLYAIDIPYEDSLWTCNSTNTPTFIDYDGTTILSNQLFFITKQSNGRYLIASLNGVPSGYNNYMNQYAQFGSSTYSSSSSTMNIYYNGTNYAIQNAQSGGNGFWYLSTGSSTVTINAQSGSSNYPNPLSYPFALVPVDTIFPINYLITSRLLSVTASGTLANNTYNWYLNGTLLISKTGDSTLLATQNGTYYVTVTNSVNTSYTLVSTSITVTSTNFYNKASADIGVFSNWGTNTDGSGIAPTTFSGINQIFNITNSGAVINTSLTVSGTGSSLNIGSFTASSTLTISSGKTLLLFAPMIIGPASELYINSGGAANFNGQSVTLQASVIGIAKIGAINGSLSGATNVTVQCYLPGHRAFRFLGHPFKNAIALSQLTSSIDITGPGGFINGFTSTASNAPSAFYYNSSLPSWAVFSNTIASNWGQWEGIRLLVRGAVGQGLKGETPVTSNPTTGQYLPSAVTLSMTGQLNIGTQTIPLTYTGNDTTYNLVSNPFPSSIDVSQVTGNNIASAYYVWNSKVATTGQPRGAYFANSFGGATDIIPMCSSFFVAATGSSPSVTIPESIKNDAAPISIFGADSSNINTLELLLQEDSTTDDRVLVNFKDDALRGTDYWDGAKLSNPVLNFYTLSADNQSLSIDCRPTNDDADTIALNIDNVANGKYTIIASSKTLLPNKAIFLVDELLGNIVPLKAGTSYNFSIVDSGNINNRFVLIVNKTGDSAPSEPSGFKATLGSTFINNRCIVNFTAPRGGITTARLVNVLGQTLISKSLNNTISGQIVLPTGNLSSNGIYFIEVMNNGSRVVLKAIK